MSIEKEESSYGSSQTREVEFGIQKQQKWLTNSANIINNFLNILNENKQFTAIPA